MLQMDLSARVRHTTGKGAARELRRQGKTPAVLYGPKSDVVSLEIDTRSFTKTLLYLHRRNAVISLDVESEGKTEKRHVMIKEVQADPVKDTVVHADFFEISLEEPITIKVPILYTGKARGVDLGGELHALLTEIPMKGKALDIPDSIEFDVTDMDINDKHTCKDLEIPEGITLLESEDSVCVSVQHAVEIVEPEEEEAAEAEAAEVVATEEASPEA